MNTYQEAEATFRYRVGDIANSITVGSKSGFPRSRDDWLIRLALDAGIQVSQKHNTDIKAVSFKLDNITLDDAVGMMTLNPGYPDISNRLKPDNTSESEQEREKKSDRQ